MTDDMEAWLDPDIKALDLSYLEKSGLQVYRNYTKSFEKSRIENFQSTVLFDELDLTDFQRFLDLVVSEEVRFLPIIACGYADDLLKSLFRQILPKDVPGGVAELFGPYGPISDLSQRIKLAYLFDCLSKDLMKDLDNLRKIRNKIAHEWKSEFRANIFLYKEIKEITAVKEIFRENVDVDDIYEKLKDPESALRVKITWILGRMFYECAAYNKAKLARIDPHQALYKGKPKWLSDISALCKANTLKIAANADLQ